MANEFPGRRNLFELDDFIAAGGPVTAVTGSKLYDDASGNGALYVNGNTRFMIADADEIANQGPSSYIDLTNQAMVLLGKISAQTGIFIYPNPGYGDSGLFTQSSDATQTLLTVQSPGAITGPSIQLAAGTGGSVNLNAYDSANNVYVPFVFDAQGIVFQTGTGSGGSLPTTASLDSNGLFTAQQFASSGGSGVDGTFTTADFKTVTVSGGIVTDIS